MAAEVFCPKEKGKKEKEKEKKEKKFFILNVFVKISTVHCSKVLDKFSKNSSFKWGLIIQKVSLGYKVIIYLFKN